MPCDGAQCGSHTAVRDRHTRVEGSLIGSCHTGAAKHRRSEWMRPQHSGCGRALPCSRCTDLALCAGQSTKRENRVLCCRHSTAPSATTSRLSGAASSRGSRQPLRSTCFSAAFAVGPPDLWKLSSARLNVLRHPTDALLDPLATQRVTCAAKATPLAHASAKHAQSAALPRAQGCKCVGQRGWLARQGFIRLVYAMCHGLSLMRSRSSSSTQSTGVSADGRSILLAKKRIGTLVSSAQSRERRTGNKIGSPMLNSHSRSD
jgi:hypothetical protein